MQQLQHALQQGNLLLARELCNAARKAAPQNPAYAVISGDIYYNQRFLEDAEKDYSAALSLDKNYAPAFFGIGRIYQLKATNSGDHAFYLQALEHYKMVLQHKSDHFLALLAATEICINIHEIEEACVYFARLKDLNRDLLDVWVYGGILNMQKSPADLEAAIICFQTALRKSPNHPLVLISLATALVRSNRTEEAEQALIQITDEQHKTGQYYALYADIADKHKDYKKSLDLYNTSCLL